jgi:NAD(P)-dependent dehydrogenase (short-subunit alcohol dehydrogenase family)
MTESEPRTIVITGASSGIGRRRAAADLAGQRVVIVGRDPRRTRQVADELGMPFHVADFAVLAQVRALADELRASYPRIDVLANNAGGIFGDRTVTVDGFEATFQTNHLAAFLLTNLLRDRLVDAEPRSSRPRASPRDVSRASTSTTSTPSGDTLRARHTATRSSRTSCSRGRSCGAGATTVSPRPPSTRA